MNGISRQLPKVLRVLNSEMSLLRVNDKADNRPIRISVEGNIGSGKSTFLNYFKQFSFVETYSEPLEKWRNVQGHNLLELLYDDMTKWNVTFQSYVQLTRMQVQTSTPREGVKVQMFERSVQNNRFCFMENALNSGFLLPAQFSVLCKWYEWIQENVDISLDLIVYLRTSPEVVYKRVLNRNRSEERTISLKYLESLHQAHEKWLTNPNQTIPVLCVDANVCFDDIIESCQKKLPVLFNQDSNALHKLQQKTAVILLKRVFQGIHKRFIPGEEVFENTHFQDSRILSEVKAKDYSESELQLTQDNHSCYVTLLTERTAVTAKPKTWNLDLLEEWS